MSRVSQHLNGPSSPASPRLGRAPSGSRGNSPNRTPERSSIGGGGGGLPRSRTQSTVAPVMDEGSGDAMGNEFVRVQMNNPMRQLRPQHSLSVILPSKTLCTHPVRSAQLSNVLASANMQACHVIEYNTFSNTKFLLLWQHTDFSTRNPSLFSVLLG